MMISKFLVLFCLLFTTPEISAGTSDDVKRLFREKIDPLDPRIMPVKNQSDEVHVEFKVHLGAITDFDELVQKISTTMWLEVKWVDEQIKWNETEYGGVQKIFPHPDDIWRPHIAVGNSFKEKEPLGAEFVLLIANSDGTVTWYPGTKLETFCKVDIELYPFDTQNCEFDFFNWGTIKGELSLTTFDGGLLLDSYHKNGEWEFKNFSVRDFIHSYSNGSIIKPHTSINITIKRRSSVIVLTVLLPVALLAFLDIFTFYIPAESGEKLSFGVTILLSLAVFLSYINSMMPQTSESISYLSVYISAQLIVSSLIVLLSCISLAIYHREDNGSKIGKLYRCLVPKMYDESMKGDIFRHMSRRFDAICYRVFMVFTIFCTVVFMIALSGVFENVGTVDDLSHSVIYKE